MPISLKRRHFLFLGPKSHGCGFLLLLLFFKFAVPFVCLLPRWVKRNYITVSAISILILVMQYVDIYWLVYPSLDQEVLRWDVLDLGFFLGFFGLFLYSIFKFFSKYPALPVQDPMEQKSTGHHVTY